MSFRRILLLIILAANLGSTSAQVKLTQDTIDSPFIGFNFGTVFASSKFSTEGGMSTLYPSPYLAFGLEAGYKFKSNWFLSADGTLIIGHDLNDKYDRLTAVYSHDSSPFVIGTNGTDANMTCYNRALHFRVGGGRIFTLSSKNPNSGIMLRMMGGFIQQKTIFMLNDVKAPQIQDDYARLYDHKRRGATLTESIGYWFMSNNYNFFNFYIAFEVTQCWSHSVRDYVLDPVMGLHGPDNTNYFDLLYTIKINWMFPLKGKTAYDYYFF